jgi:hypothetical protein
VLKVVFASLVSGSVATVKTDTFDSLSQAFAAVATHAAEGGFTTVKQVEEEDSVRFTATSPEGRSGRNVAFAEWLGDETDE